MKILFAAPDRDLLECYKKLLETDFGEIVTVFDGTQVFALLSNESFDIVILDREIPRIDYKKILARTKEKHIPVIVLTDSSVCLRQLTQEPLPNAYLSYPFTALILEQVIRDTLEKTSSAELLDFYGLKLNVSEFKIVDGPQLTSGEIDILKSLLENKYVLTDDGASISALNIKFSGAGSRVRIKYRAKKGYELVNEEE